jgi:hypothetical protein
VFERKPVVPRELHQLLLGLGMPQHGPHPTDYNTLDIAATADTHELEDPAMPLPPTYSARFNPEHRGEHITERHENT